MQRRDFLVTCAGAVASFRLLAEEPFGSLPASLWRNARWNGLVMIHRPAPSRLSWSTEIVGKDEPGERLIVSGEVVAPDGRTPAAGVVVYAYNTDAAGYYGANHAEYPPRLYGWMKTDSAGRFELHTIRPGSYPGMRVPAHIHFVVWGGGYPLQWVEELRFEGDRYLTEALVAEDAGRGDFRSIRRAARGEDGVWRCDFRVRVQRQGNYR